MPAVPLIEEPPKPRPQHKLGLRTALTGLVLLTVAVTAILIHLTWFYAARRNVADVVGQLNRQIVGSVQHEVRATLNDAWSVQEAMRSIFFQEAIKPTDEAKREFIFLALLRSHPTLSWIALGFPDGAFFGALKATDDEIDMVEVKRNPETGIRQQRVDTYTPQPGDVLFRSGLLAGGRRIRTLGPSRREVLERSNISTRWILFQGGPRVRIRLPPARGQLRTVRGW